MFIDPRLLRFPAPQAQCMSRFWFRSCGTNARIAAAQGIAGLNVASGRYRLAESIHRVPTISPDTTARMRKRNVTANENPELVSR